MKRTHIVLDTSYLLELYRVSGFSKQDDHETIKSRMMAANLNGAIFFIAQGVVFEVANHIADVRNAPERTRLANQWRDEVWRSIRSEDDRLFTIHPGSDLDGLGKHLTTWADILARGNAQKKDKGDIGLTDWGSVVVAHSLKDSKGRPIVHIWTKDRRLKLHEPDPEEDQFLGS